MERRSRRPLRCLTLALALAALAAAAPPPAAEPDGQSAGEDGGPHASYDRVPAPEGWTVTLGFLNFNGDPLEVSAPLKEADVKAAVAEFGYAKGEVDAIFKGCEGVCDQEEFDRRVDGYYRERGLDAVREAGRIHLAVDMRTLVKRNAPRVRALAAALDERGRAKGYGSAETLGAALAMTQTAFPYASPPDEEGGRAILGLWVPPRLLESGKGDCDSKTGLLASVLANFPGARLIGIHIPRHYLMGVARLPQTGEAYIDYAGQPYVLLEPVGPAWLPPGKISERSQSALDTMNGVRVDPLF